MGEDLHSKVYMYSKVEKKYIDALQLHDHCAYEFNEMFPSIFPDRCYDVFSIICGSRRSDLRELTCGTDGTPKFLKGTSFMKFLDSMKGDYYNFKHYKIGELYDGVVEYIGNLRDPIKYYSIDEDDCDSLEDLKSDEDFFKSVKEDFDTVANVLTDVKTNIERYYEIRDMNDQYDFRNSIKDIVDIDKTIILFWLSN